MSSISTVLLLLTGFQSVFGQWAGGAGGFGGFGGFGFGCGQTVSTVGSECYVPETGKGTVICVALASSVYANAGYFGAYNPYLAVDGQLSPGNSGFFHSNLEPYPWLKVMLRKPDNTDYEPKPITRVEIFQRCDANELYHQTAFEIKLAEDVTDATLAKQVVGSPRLIGGKYCATTNQVFFFGGTKFTVFCNAAVAATPMQEVWIQKTTLHSHGSGWPNYNGNQWNSYTGNAPAQNSNWPVAFLMINEVVLY